MIAGLEYNISCEAEGSSPFVLYNWTLSLPGSEDKYVRSSITTPASINKQCFLSQMGNNSVISVLASTTQHNSTLHCLAFNPLLPDISVQDDINIIIQCKSS